MNEQFERNRNDHLSENRKVLKIIKVIRNIYDNRLTYVKV